MAQHSTFLTSAERSALRSIAEKVPRPELGLPHDVFAFALRIVGMTNVDLLTFDDRGRVLLAWREDEYAQGWHVPGGIMRGEEGIERRIAETARTEMGAPVKAEPFPSAILQFRGQRGSFISLVYRCQLGGTPPNPIGEERPRAAPGKLSWFAEMPPATLPSHEVYRELLPELRAGRPTGGMLTRTSLFTPDQGWRRVEPSSGG